MQRILVEVGCLIVVLCTILTWTEAQPQTISDIPDITDSPPLPTKELANVNLTDDKEEEEIGDIPDMNEIPDMEDEGAGLEDGEDDAAVKIVHPSA